jgi:hypothetical protein
VSTRRLLAFVAVLLGALVSSANAAYAGTPTGGWTDPAANGTYQGTPIASIEQLQKLKGHADIQNGSISGVDFSLAQDADGASGTPCSASNVVKAQHLNGSSSSHIDFAFDAPFPCNKKYKVRARVTPSPQLIHQPANFDLWIAVAIAPAPTTGLVATTPSGADRGVKLTWSDAAREPDFAGFEVRRAVGTGTFAPVADVAPGATSWTDADVPASGGTFRYQVVAMRPGPDAGTTVFSATGATVSATVRAAPDGSTGGSGSGSTGGDGKDSKTSSSTARGEGIPSGSASAPVHREYAVPGSSSKTRTTIDTGYNEKLPFGQRAAGGGEGGSSAVANFAGDNGDSGTRRTMLLVGGASVTFSWAMLLRVLSRRALY